ncbi:MAG: PrgI family protein, partial [Nanoarchaeota archaeon]|nr:PrgI family protein [Nanoarchaeota archaeon]
IPQQLEYKEKIIFGLTFQQLLYAIIFSPVAIAILFKLPFPLYIRISLALIPSGMAGIFMFTNIPKQFKNWSKWLRWQRFDNTHPKMKLFLEIEKIENEVILLK